MIGPVVAVPVPRAVLDAVQEIKVESNSGETQSGFEITFRISNRSPLQTLFLLTGGSSIPILRVVIAVTYGGETTVLMDGVMTHHELRSDSGPTPTLVMKGKDLSALMHIVPLEGLPYPAMSPAVRVLVALAKYAALGIVPLVIPSVLEDVPIPIERIPRHQGTDLDYINALAHEVGYVFYIDPGPVPGVSKAYWGPEIRRRRAAARAQPRPRRSPRERQEPDVPLRQGEEGASDRLHPGAGEQGADSAARP